MKGKDVRWDIVARLVRVLAKGTLRMLAEAGDNPDEGGVRVWYEPDAERHVWRVRVRGDSGREHEYAEGFRRSLSPGIDDTEGWSVARQVLSSVARAVVRWTPESWAAVNRAGNVLAGRAAASCRGEAKGVFVGYEYAGGRQVVHAYVYLRDGREWQTEVRSAEGADPLQDNVAEALEAYCEAMVRKAVTT